MVDAGHAQDPGVGDELGRAPSENDNKLYLVDVERFIPYKIFCEDKVVTVNEHPGDVAEEEHHDNAHEDEGQVDFALNRISGPNMGKPK